MTNHHKKEDFSKVHVHVAPWVLMLIKQHAMHHSQEIYGWLIGREMDSGDIYVSSAMPCEHYQEQSFIGAAPDPRDQQGIGNALPCGLGIIGIYHSHPTEIFHSSTDNRTLLNLSRFYPRMLSAVTNADHYPDPTQNLTKWFQKDKEGEFIQEITVNAPTIPPNQVSTVLCKVDFNFEVVLPCEGNLGASLLRILLDEFEHNWTESSFDVSQMKKGEFPLSKIASSQIVFSGKNKSLYSLAKLSSSRKLSKYLPREDLFIACKFSTQQISSLPLESDSKSPIATKSPMIRISGQIPLLAGISVDLSVKRPTLEPILVDIKAELLDDLILKVSRGCFSPPSSPSPPRSDCIDVILQTPETKLFSYPGIKPAITLPLFADNLKSLAADHKQIWEKFSQHAPSFPRENFPQFSKVITLENQILDNFSQRAIVLGYSDQKTNAHHLLEELIAIHIQRGNKTQAALLADTILALLSSDHNEDLKNDHSN